MWSTILKSVTSALSSFLLSDVMKPAIANIIKAATKYFKKKEARETGEELEEAKTPQDRFDRFDNLK